MCVKICVILFKIFKNMFKLSYQTHPHLTLKDLLDKKNANNFEHSFKRSCAKLTQR